MQFQIPQFIETEDKIVGPLTLKQFGYIGGGGLSIFVLFFILDFFFWLMLSTLIAAAAVGLAFVKINGQPLITVLVNAVGFMMRPRLYIWNRKLEEKTIDIPEPKVIKKTEAHRPANPGAIQNLSDKLKTTTSAIPLREKPLLGNFARPKEKDEGFVDVQTQGGNVEKAKRVDFN